MTQWKEGNTYLCLKSTSVGYKEGESYLCYKNDQGLLCLKGQDGLEDLCSRLISTFREEKK